MKRILFWSSIYLMSCTALLPAEEISKNQEWGDLTGSWKPVDSSQLQFGMLASSFPVRELIIFDTETAGIISDELAFVADVVQLNEEFLRLDFNADMFPDLLVRWRSKEDRLIMMLGGNSYVFDREEGHEMIDFVELLQDVSAENEAKQKESDLAKTKTNMRVFAVAIEAYYVDNNRFPASTTNNEMSIHSRFLEERPDLAGQSTFMTNRGTDGPHTITTPISYLTSYYEDPFAPVEGMTFNYHTDGKKNWLLWSPGPDGDYDIEYSILSNDSTKDRNLLLNGSENGTVYTYDPSNGTVSNGDIWRDHLN